MRRKPPTLDYGGRPPADRSVWDSGWLMLLLYGAFVALLFATTLAVAVAWHWFHI